MGRFNNLFKIALLSLLTTRAAAEAEEVVDKTWAKSVQAKVDNGQFVFVKFLAPW